MTHDPEQRATSRRDQPVADDVVVSCRELACGYGAERILAGIDLTIRRGEMVSLLGGSGSGKSTLLKTIVGLLPPLAGEACLLGENLAELDEPARARVLCRTGMLFQHGALFGSLSVHDNCALPVREHFSLPEPVITEMVRMKLALVGLDSHRDALPGELSGGQRKRVALARAAILDPEIIFCDEPTAGLDPMVAAGLDQTLRHFRDLFGITIIAVTHDLASIEEISDRAIMLGDGRILASGTVAELTGSDIPAVAGYFQRVPARPGDGEGTVLDWLEAR